MTEFTGERSSLRDLRTQVVAIYFYVILAWQKVATKENPSSIKAKRYCEKLRRKPPLKPHKWIPHLRGTLVTHKASGFATSDIVHKIASLSLQGSFAFMFRSTGKRHHLPFVLLISFAFYATHLAMTAKRHSHNDEICRFAMTIII